MKQVDKKSDTTFSESHTVGKLRRQLRGKGRKIGNDKERRYSGRKGDCVEG
jgi:hypothetical protein